MPIGGENILKELHVALEKVNKDVDHFSTDLFHLKGIVRQLERSMELKENSSINELDPIKKEMEVMVEKLEKVVHENQDLVSSHNTTRTDVDKLQAELEVVKQQLLEVQEESNRSRFLSEPPITLGEENNKQHLHSPNRIKIESQKKRWSWGESSSVKETIDRLFGMVRSIEARLKQSKSSKDSQIDNLIADLKKFVMQQIRDNDQLPQQSPVRGGRRRSSSKNKRDSGYLESPAPCSSSKDFQYDPLLQHQMSIDSATAVPTSSLTGASTNNVHTTLPKSISEEETLDQALHKSTPQSLPSFSSSPADSFYQSSSSRMVESYDPRFDTFLHSFLEVLNRYDFNSAQEK